MKGTRKLQICYAYLIVVGAVAALEVILHSPSNLLGMAALAAGLASGLGTFMWGNAQEHRADVAANK